MNFVTRTAIALGSLGVVGLASACGAPAETDATAKTDTALSVASTPTVSLAQVTGAPVDSGATCGSTLVAPPASLADFDCSWGVEVLSDPGLKVGSHYEASFARMSTGESVRALVWACRAVSSSGAPLETAPVPVGGCGVLREPITVPPRTACEVGGSTYTDSCFGAADPGYVLMVEAFPTEQPEIPVGCPQNACGDTVWNLL